MIDQAPPVDEELGPDAGIEEEDTGSGEGPVKPWDPRKIRITTKQFTLREVVEMINQEEVDLAPDFQRAYVWKQRQRTRLVESILLGIPLPAFYFNQEESGNYQVVDGVQRLSTVRLFMGGGHRLDRVDLEYLADLDGCGFSDLDAGLQRRLKATQIVVHVIEPQTPDEVKYDIFSRVNTLGSPLSAQEIRHAMSKPASRAFLKELAESPAFDRATGWRFWARGPDGESVRNGDRMTDRELVLRYCAFHGFNLGEYRKYDSLDALLMDFMRRLGPRSDAERAALAADFRVAMENAAVVLGRFAFRKAPPGGRRGPLSRAVFESQSLALTGYPHAEVAARREAVEGALRGLFNDAEYTRAVTIATGNPSAVALRLARARDAVAAVMG